MEQRVSLITLAVEDVTRSRRFYERLGWSGHELEGTAFFQAGGIAVVLWGRDALADDAGVAAGTPVPFGGIVLAHNVRSSGEVDAILATVEPAGGRVTRPAATTFYGGYAGYFADPDGHLWEVAHNPGFTLEPNGSLTLPDFNSA
jgi:catechol 2,3-dioxygenase-like lactoylglutathione lyase family enzyme